MRRTSKCLVILLIVFLYSYAIHILANAIINIAEAKDFFGTLLTSISYVIKTFSVALITHWIRVVRNPGFSSSGNKRTRVERWTTTTTTQKRSWSKRAYWFSYLTIWCVSLGAFAFRIKRMVTWLSENDPQEYFTFSFYRANLTTLGWPTGLSRAFVAFDWCSYNILFLMTAIQFTTFLNSCGQLNATFNALLDSVGDLLNPLYGHDKKSLTILTNTVHRFRVFDRQFASAAEEFQSVENRFSLPLFVWISEAVAYIILTSRRIKMTDFNKISINSLVVDAVFYMSVYALVLVHSSRIDETYKEICRLLSSKGIDIPPERQELYFQFDLSLKAVRSTRCCLTGFNFYYIDRAFGLTTVGMVFTYLVVVMQI